MPDNMWKDAAPCPWCGCEQIESGADEVSEYMPGFTVFGMCRRCHAQGPIVVNTSREPDEDIEERALGMWNKREPGTQKLEARR